MPSCTLSQFSLGIVGEAVEILELLWLGQGHEGHVHVVGIPILLDNELHRLEMAATDLKLTPGRGEERLLHALHQHMENPDLLLDQVLIRVARDKDQVSCGQV